MSVCVTLPPSPSNRHSSRAFGDVAWCVSLDHLFCSSVSWGTLFGECLCVLLLSFLCFLGKDVVSCVVVCVTYIILVFFGRRFVCSCVCYVYRFRVFWGEKKMVQRITEAVVDYEDRLRKMQSLPRFSYGRGMVSSG